MSAQAGIFKFDPRDRVKEEELMGLARGIDRAGPDGGAEYFTQSLAVAYRAFYTTRESKREAQPLVRHGSVLTWDGRLDNREEILAKLSRKYEEMPTDLELVFAAYEESGTRCFRELIGDWALVLWDQEKQKLILARDYIGVRRLFYRSDKATVAWCTTIEPLVQTSPVKLHLDLDYLAGYLYPRAPVESTPYQEIRSIVPASFLAFEYGGKQTAEQYWSLNPRSRIRYSTDSEYEEHFRCVFRDSVNRRLRADRTILAELSGGIDSSSIVCMADDIRCHHPRVRIETLSYYDTDEPSGDERPYFSLVEKKRGRKGHHISVSDFTRETIDEALKPPPDHCFVASPGYSARTLHWASAIDAIQTQAGARVILSGLGGDEVLGGIQYEAPELADYLLAGRLISFSKAIIRWSLARKKTVYRLLADTVELIIASHHPQSFVAPPRQRIPWVRLTPATHHAALHSFARWGELSPHALCMESLRYSLAEQLTCTDPPLIGNLEKRYPYLDRSLFVFLASIPRTQLLQAGMRRYLMRRALDGVVPTEVLRRKTKWFGFRNSAAILSLQQGAIDALFAEDWLSNTTVVDAAMLRQHLKAAQHGALSEGMELRAALGIEQWLRSQTRLGTLESGTPSMQGRGASPRV
jgi:asparagine synthase (glutamine-hydrolysing)